MWMLCLFGFHRRSRGRAHEDETGYVSVCRRCHKPMRKAPGGKWSVIDPPG
jgi:hypothetical protein